MYAINRSAPWVTKDPKLPPELVIQDAAAWTLLPSLPSRLRLSDGSARTSLDELDEKQLAELGIYPAKVDQPLITSTQMYGEPKFDFDGSTVTTTYPVLDKPKEQVALELAEAKTSKLAELAQARWEQETGGITVNGASVCTDDRSKSLLAGAVDRARNDPKVLIEWKASGDNWVVLDSKTIILIGEAVSNHVQSCFSKECALSGKVRACATIEEVNSIKWENP